MLPAMGQGVIVVADGKEDRVWPYKELIWGIPFYRSNWIRRSWENDH